MKQEQLEKEILKKKLEDIIPEDECNYHLRDTHWIPEITELIKSEILQKIKELEKKLEDLQMVTNKISQGWIEKIKERVDELEKRRQTREGQKSDELYALNIAIKELKSLLESEKSMRSTNDSVSDNSERLLDSTKSKQSGSGKECQSSENSKGDKELQSLKKKVKE